MSSTESGQTSDRLLNLLLYESAEARDDDRYMFAQYAAILGAAVLIIGYMATVFTLTCPKGYGACPPNDKITPISIWLYVLAPMLPALLIAYALFISAILTLRSYYLRSLEQRIHELTGQQDDLAPIPSWAHIQLEITGQFHAGRSATLNFLLIYGLLSLMMAGCLYLALIKIPDLRLQIFALAIDATLMGILISAAVQNVVNGSRIWKDALEGLPKRLGRTEANFPPREHPDGERTLLSFLLLPRNQEELLKALFIPISFWIGRCLAPGLSPLMPERIWYSVGFFVVFEFVIYQARYLLNDVRDRRVDCEKNLSQRRFPCSWARDKELEIIALRAAFASFAARLAMAGLLVGCILPMENWKWVWHTGFLVGVFLIALPYESFRFKCNAAAKVGSQKWTTIWTGALIGVVGFGYGLRSVVGLWLAGVDDKVALVLVAIAASLFGSTFVAFKWALESTRDEENALAAGKGHLVLFRKAVSRDSKLAVGPNDRVLMGRQSLLAPWSFPAVLATVGLAAFTLHLLRDHLSDLSGGRSIIVAVAVLVIVGGAVITPLRTSLLLTALSIVGVVVLLHSHSVPITQSVLATAIIALPLIVTCSFRSMCFGDLPGFTEKIIGVGAAGMRSIYSWFVRAR